MLQQILFPWFFFFFLSHFCETKDQARNRGRQKCKDKWVTAPQVSYECTICDKETEGLPEGECRL